MSNASMTQVAHERSKRLATPRQSHERFKVQRDRGGADWSVIDRSKNIPVATGLDFDEAQNAAEARNKRRGRKSSF